MVLRTTGRAFLGEAELTEREGAVLLALAGTVFSFTAVAYRAVDAANDWQFLAYRGGSTALAMLGLVALRHRSRPVDFVATTWKAIVAGFLLAITSMLYILALSRISAATTLLLLAAAPVYAAVFGWLLLRERVHSATFIAIGVTMVGVAIMVGTGLDAGSGVGLVFAMLIPILVGLYNVVLRSAPGTDPVVPALLAGVFLALGATAAAFISQWRSRGVMERRSFGMCEWGSSARDRVTAVQPWTPVGSRRAGVASAYDRDRSCPVVGLDLAR